MKLSSGGLANRRSASRELVVVVIMLGQEYPDRFSGITVFEAKGRDFAEIRR